MMKPTYSTTAEILSIYRDTVDARSALTERSTPITPEYKTASQILATFPRRIQSHRADPLNS